jgi:transcriptional regulator with XRE-family HTH domain
MLEIEQTFRSATPFLDAAPFGDLLRGLRRSAALSQEELAERAGLSLRGISDLERGVRRAPHLTTVRLLAEALALTGADRQAFFASPRPARRTDVSSAPIPTAPSSPIGQETELGDLRVLLARVAVLLAILTGPADIGTMGLGPALAAGVSEELGDGVVFVALAAIPGSTFVTPAELPSGQPRRRLRRAAPPRRWPPRCGSSPSPARSATGVGGSRTTP